MSNWCGAISKNKNQLAMARGGGEKTIKKKKEEEGKEHEQGPFGKPRSI